MSSQFVFIILREVGWHTRQSHGAAEKKKKVIVTLLPGKRRAEANGIAHVVGAWGIIIVFYYQ